MYCFYISLLTHALFFLYLGSVVGFVSFSVVVVEMVFEILLFSVLNLLRICTGSM